ncbi:hypothetical protein GXW83_32310 [Streptacidiphilus sp. PB12-B1b]|uniref:hypothetical protein n=1 Tax=Streptacidiphilus sp. PB12-B1b TaxID=2705012 RepID=UPI0015F92C73|nr:hypothetical protein [Streptacidiphilus sp. PB12-B1b]QMU79693.1 hypothetical protein GXW83_32310 [Streptacidiphilus sp. PB12-B1b]
MALEFIGVDPSTDDRDSPTVWVDPDSMEIVLQGWKAGDELRSKVYDCPAPRHAPGIPDHEDIIRIPARMAALLRKACDVAEGLDG